MATILAQMQPQIGRMREATTKERESRFHLVGGGMVVAAFWRQLFALIAILIHLSSIFSFSLANQTCSTISISSDLPQHLELHRLSVISDGDGGRATRKDVSSERASVTHCPRFALTRIVTRQATPTGVSSDTMVRSQPVSLASRAKRNVPRDPW